MSPAFFSTLEGSPAVAPFPLQPLHWGEFGLGTCNSCFLGPTQDRWLSVSYNVLLQEDLAGQEIFCFRTAYAPLNSGSVWDISLKISALQSSIPAKTKTGCRNNSPLFDGSFHVLTLSVLGGSYFRLSRQADELVRRSLQFELISALLLLNALSRTGG